MTSFDIISAEHAKCKFAYIIVADGQVDIVAESRGERTAHMNYLLDAGFDALCITVPWDKQDQIIDEINEGRHPDVQ